MSSAEKKRFYVTTISGNEVDLPDPQAWSINPEDIAHALGMTCRFNGQIPWHYSVAEHSLHVSRLVEKYAREEYPDIDPMWVRKLSLGALLHDASEYILADLISPVKHYIGSQTDAYQLLERQVMGRVVERFSLEDGFWDHPLVGRADKVMYATERAQLTPETPRKGEHQPLPGYDLGLERQAAKEAWLRRFWDLYKDVATPARIEE